MPRRNLYLFIVIALFSAQFLSAFAPVNAMPSVAPQLQAVPTITLNGTILAYAIKDPSAIGLAGARILISDGSGAPPGQAFSQVNGSWTYTYNAAQPAVDLTIRFVPPVGYELPPSLPPDADTARFNNVPAGATLNLGSFSFRRRPYQFSGLVKTPGGAVLSEVPVKISYGLPGVARTAAKSVVVPTTASGYWIFSETARPDIRLLPDRLTFWIEAQTRETVANARRGVGLATLRRT